MKVTHLFEAYSWDDDYDPPTGWDDIDYDINDLSEDEQLERIKQDPEEFIKIENPSSKLVADAFFYTPWLMSDLKRKGIPITKDMAIYAISIDPYIIEEVGLCYGTVTDDMKWLALKKNPNTILHYIPNPTPDMLKFALTQPVVIEDKQFYEDVARKFLSNNQIIMKKWIRYGDTMRGDS
jgi:hypothetical protein